MPFYFLDRYHIQNIRNNVGTSLDNNFYYAYFDQFVIQLIHQFGHTFDVQPFDQLYKKYIILKAYYKK